ncbi:hypothetical protein [Sphingomonas sp. MMS24-J13]|uniref:Pam3-gp28 family putative phage holin n=1 Tax=Sphingomonas sp. MMS24-J13 TaxID=3238686 RepID=UPI0038505A02
MSDIPAPAATAARALLASAVRHALTAAGTALVTRGLVDQGAVDGFMATGVEMVVGALIVAGATCWGQFRAWMSHGRFAAAWAALNGEQQSAGVAGAMASLSPAAAGQADSAGPAA